MRATLFFLLFLVFLTIFQVSFLSFNSSLRNYLDITLLVVCAATVFLTPARGITAALVVGFFIGISSGTSLGLESLALIVSCVITPSLFEYTTRKKNVNFILSLIISPQVFLVTMWLLIPLIEFLKLHTSQTIDLQTFKFSLLISLGNVTIGILCLACAKIFSSVFQKQFFLKSRA